jgi:hypothetical protein
MSSQGRKEGRISRKEEGKIPRKEGRKEGRKDTKEGRKDTKEGRTEGRKKGTRLCIVSCPLFLVLVMYMLHIYLYNDYI